jgi:branched-chain amino acid transport system substrate-binding protein
MGKLVIVTLTVLIVAAMLAGGCAKPAPATPLPVPPSAPPKTLDIGIATPLTGPAASVGTNLQNATLLAIDDQNKQGGVTIGGEKYVLNGIVRDTKFDLVVGKSVAEELIFDKGVKAISGPFIADGVGVQVVTEKNKIIMFSEGSTPGRIGPNKPYTFSSFGGSMLGTTIIGAEYIQEFYPGSKTVVSITPDIPVLQITIDATKAVCQRCGLDWLGYEKFAMTVNDFMPIISRALAKKPDIIDTSTTGGTMGGVSAVLLKQLREAGFNGLIWAPTVPPAAAVLEIVPERYRTKIITSDVLVDSPIVSQAYKDTYQRYIDKFGETPIDAFGEQYNGVKAFFEFLNGQDSMDTTVWINGFEKYHWQGLFGHEAFWLGKPIYGIDRVALRPFYASEWIDGKLETRWEAPIPWELFVEQ